MPPKFKGTEGQFVSTAAATRLQENYLKGKRCENIQEPIRGEFFGIDQLKKLLSKKTTKGIRVYHAEDEDGNPRVILVAVDEDAKKIVKDKNGIKDGGDDDYLADGPLCPQQCEE